MASASTVKRYVKELGRRARGGEPRPVHTVHVDPSGNLGDHLRLAADHADILAVPAEARMRPVKQGIMRVAQLFGHHQVVYNRAVLDALAEVDTLLDDGPGTSRGAAALAALEVLVQDLGDQVAALAADNAALRAEMAELRGQQADVRTEARVTRSRVDAVVSEVRAAPGAPAATVSAEAFATLSDARHDEVYAAFERTFRGSREEILALVRGYAVELAGVATTTGGGRVLDIGCGRGELLEALRDEGVDAYGVDSSATFAEQGAELGLEVERADGLAHLRSLPDDSLAGITALHVIEHLALESLFDLVDESLRVLRPGGLLLLETPNPMTWQVGANAFYLDPTHIKPVHPYFLRFLFEARGFAEVDLRFLHPAEGSLLPPPAVVNEPVLGQLLERWNAVAAGPHDYAVAGVKPRLRS